MLWSRIRIRVLWQCFILFTIINLSMGYLFYGSMLFISFLKKCYLFYGFLLLVYNKNVYIVQFIYFMDYNGINLLPTSALYINSNFLLLFSMAYFSYNQHNNLLSIIFTNSLPTMLLTSLTILGIRYLQDLHSSITWFINSLLGGLFPTI